MSFNDELRQIDECLEGPSLPQRAGTDEPTQYLSYFNVQQMRRVDGLARIEDAISDIRRERGLKQQLEDGRRIDHNHRASRSARTAAVGSTCASTRSRSASRARISSSVGRSASLRTSRIRYS